MIRCRVFGHQWRPDPIWLFGVCRRCGTPSEHPQPGQNDPEKTLAILSCSDCGDYPTGDDHRCPTTIERDCVD